jgi:hypothetical protein
LELTLEIKALPLLSMACIQPCPTGRVNYWLNTVVIVSEKSRRVENRRRDFSLPVATDDAFASSPQSGLAWLCFLFPLVEPDRQVSRIRLSEKTHTETNFGM